MRRGLLKNYTDTICDIFTGWRLLVSPGDLPLLMAAGAGLLHMDLTSGATSLDGLPVNIRFTSELRNWLKERADADGLGWANVTTAALDVAFDFREKVTAGQRRTWWQTRGPVVTHRELSFNCTATIDTPTGSATSRKTMRTYGKKIGSGPYVVA